MSPGFVKCPLGEEEWNCPLLRITAVCSTLDLIISETLKPNFWTVLGNRELRVKLYESQYVCRCCCSWLLFFFPLPILLEAFANDDSWNDFFELSNLWLFSFLTSFLSSICLGFSKVFKTAKIFVSGVFFFFTAKIFENEIIHVMIYFPSSWF